MKTKNKTTLTTIQSNDVEKIYVINPDFFLVEGLAERIKHKIKLFNRKIHQQSQVELRSEIEAFYLACKYKLKRNDLYFDFLIQISKLRIQFAQKFDCIESLYKVIAEFEEPKNKGIIFSKFPFKSKYVYGYALLELFKLEQVRNKGRFSKKRLEILLKAKFYFLKIHSQVIANKIVINNSKKEEFLVLLSACLSSLNRWFEPIYYLNNLEPTSKNPNIDYMRAINLDAIKRSTCLDYNALLILELDELCSSVIDNQFSMEEQKSIIRQIQQDCDSRLTDNNITRQILKEHRRQNQVKFSEFSDYRKFCIEGQLFLNEHSFFCKCGDASKDDINIETGHLHTKINWMNDFKDLIDLLAFDFIAARKNYYNSLDSTPLINFDVSKIGRKNSRQNLKIAFLRNSFKTCYSILDQIAFGTLDAMQINYEEVLEKKYAGEIKPKLYFLNIWDFGFFKYNHFKTNPYLIALYSIAKDLDKSKIAALNDFKGIRNALEHQILIISDEKTNFKCTPKIYNRKELTENTHLLLVLTKAAIFSYVYLLRRQSKIYEITK